MVIKSFRIFVEKLGYKYPDKIIVAGNVVTPEVVYDLIMDCGVDVVKVE